MRVALLPPSRFRKPAHSPDEDGFILLAVLILLALFTIALSVALPKMAIAVQHDRDRETMERGKQYVRAIQLYYRKFQAYPPNLDALVKTNDIRFLRKKYIDPTTGKADWKPIMMCQNKTPWAMGFFGQPLAPPGCAMGGAGMVGGMPGNPAQGGIGSTGTTGGVFGNSPTGGSSIFSNSPSDGSSTGSTTTGSTTTGSTTTGTPGSGDQSGSASSGGTDAFGNPSGGPTGPTFGGGGIIGVSPASPKLSLYVYKKKDHYKDWEFLYDAQADLQQQMGGAGGMMGGQPGTGIGQPGTGQSGTSMFGNQGSSTFGPGNNTGSTPMQPTPTPTPSPQ